MAGVHHAIIVHVLHYIHIRIYNVPHSRDSAIYWIMAYLNWWFGGVLVHCLERVLGTRHSMGLKIPIPKPPATV